MTFADIVKRSDTNASSRLVQWASGVLPGRHGAPAVRKTINKSKKPVQPILPLDYGNRSPALVDKRLRYASFVSNVHGVLYVEAPKTACTALKWILSGLDSKNISLSHYPRQTSLEMCIHFRDFHPLPSLLDFSGGDVRRIMKTYRRLCAVRNPYTRLASAWANKIRLKEPGFGQICGEISAHAELRPNRQISFKDFALWVVETNDPKRCDAHWRPQANLLYPELMDYTDLLKVENLAADLQTFFETIPSLRSHDASSLLSNVYCNKSIPLDYGALYDRELADRVAEFYADDFERYGYDESSWEDLDRKGKPSYEELEAAALGAIRQRNAVIEHFGPAKAAPIAPR